MQPGEHPTDGHGSGVRHDLLPSGRLWEHGGAGGTCLRMMIILAAANLLCKVFF